MNTQIGRTPEFKARWESLMRQLGVIHYAAERSSLGPTETAEMVSLSRYQLERVAELLGCAQTQTKGSCGYCGGDHLPEECLNVFKPIIDCEHADTVDGCCNYPKNLTPECHVGACPRLDKRVRDNWEAST